MKKNSLFIDFIFLITLLIIKIIKIFIPLRLNRSYSSRLGHFVGINTLYIYKKNRNYFENLTLVPIEKDLINYNFLTKLEKDYLFKYHLNVYSKLSRYLSLNERKWLASLI